MRILQARAIAVAILFVVFLAPSAAPGQTSESIPASTSIREKHDVWSYRLSEAESFFTLEALRADGSVVLTAHWFGTPATADVAVTVLKDGDSLDVTCPKGGTDCLAFENSEARAVQDLSEVSRALAGELNDYVGDLFGHAATEECTATASFTLSPSKGVARTFGGPNAKRLNDRQKRFMNGICYIAGACATIWPIGTLICGPTAVGCAVYYFTAS